MSRKNKHESDEAEYENPVMRLEGEEAVAFVEAIENPKEPSPKLVATMREAQDDAPDVDETHCPLCREPLAPGPREQVVVAWRDRAVKAHGDCARTQG